MHCHIREIVELSVNQVEFVEKYGTTDAVHAVRLLLQKPSRKTGINPHSTLFDLEKASDKLPRKLIRYVLRQHRVPEEIIRWILLLYEKPISKVLLSFGEFPDK